MPENEGLVYEDSVYDADMISRYAAFLALQANAHTMTDEEYLKQLDAIMQDGGVPEGGSSYDISEKEYDSDVSQAVIEAIQSDDAAVTGNKKILQFEQYAGTIDEQLGTAGVLKQENTEEEAVQDGVQDQPKNLGEGGGQEVPDDNLQQNPAQNGLGHGLPTEDGTLQDDVQDDVDLEAEKQDDDDPTLEIAFEDGREQEGPVEEAPDAGAENQNEGVYVQPDVDEPDDDIQKEEGPYEAAPGTGPGTVWPGVSGATVLDLNEQESVLTGGGLHVTESYEINDWLDELGAGTGLLDGVQTAEYIPPHEEAQPVQDVKAFEKTEMMAKLDRKVEYIYGPEPGQREMIVDGPNL